MLFPSPMLQKTRSTISTPWIMSLLSPLTCVCLRATVNSRLRWNQHIDQISAAANRMLGFLRCTLFRCPQLLKEKTYKAIVRPKVEYCSSVWDPHQQKYIDKLEMTQHRAARFLNNIPFRCSKPPVSISAMVSGLGWGSLRSCAWHSGLTWYTRSTDGLVEVPQEYYPVPRPQNSARSHPRQFQRFQHMVDAFKYVFLPLTIPAWNALPQAVAEVDSDTFKRHLTNISSADHLCPVQCTLVLLHVRSFPVLIYKTFFCCCWSPWTGSHQ